MRNTNAKTIKMIVTDLDNTLLRSDKTISAYTKSVFARLRERGIKIVFATARPKRTINHFMDDIPADAVIVHNGAVIYSAEKLIGHYGIAADIRDNILTAISRDYPNLRLSVEIDDELYSNFDVSSVWNDVQAVQTDLTNPFNLPNKPADKIIIEISSMEDIESFKKYIPANLYIEMCDGRLGLIMSRNATKYKATEIVAEHFGISVDETCAFGDDYNDIPMIKGCGIGVAVENALDEVKTVADYICDISDNDGVAKWIEERVI